MRACAFVLMPTWAWSVPGGSAMSSTYNSRRLVPEVLVKGSEWAVVRPRQSVEEIWKGEKLPKWL